MESNWRLNVGKWGCYPIFALGFYWYVTLCAEFIFPNQIIRLQINRGGPTYYMDCVWDPLEGLFVQTGTVIAPAPGSRFPYGPFFLPDHP